MKKLFCIFTITAMIMSLLLYVAAENNINTSDIVILYTNDVHTYIDKPISYDIIAGVKTELKKQYSNVLLIDAGDHIQGTAYGSMDKGETVISLMNAAGYDMATPGNHEFDYGMDGFTKAKELAEFSYVSCNFHHTENGIKGENVLSPYVCYTFGEKKIAIIGITTPETFTKSTPAYFQNETGEYIYGISGGTDGSELYSDVQLAIKSAKSEGADQIIALGHLGDEEASRPYTSADVIANVSGLDAFIDGHSHSVTKNDRVKDKDGKDITLTQTGEYFDRIGIMIIDSESGEIKTDFIELSEITEKVLNENGDPALDEDGEEITEVVGYELTSEIYNGDPWPVDSPVEDMKDSWICEIDEQLGVKIGTTPLVFDNYDGEKRLVRQQETNTGNFAADALYYLFDNMGMDVDIAIMNGGGIRNKAISGDISFKTAKEIHTFGNVACLQTVKGQQILDALEWGARDVGTAECGGFLHVSGLIYSIDKAKTSSVQKNEMGIWTGAPTDGYRVYDVKIFNKDKGCYEPLDLEADYNMAGYNYTLRDLGDGFAMFGDAVNVLDYVMEDYMVLSTYIKAFKDGIVDTDNSPLSEKYPDMLIDYNTINGSGRITITENNTDESISDQNGQIENNNDKSAITAIIIISILFVAGVIIISIVRNKKIKRH